FQSFFAAASSALATICSMAEPPVGLGMPAVAWITVEPGRGVATGVVCCWLTADCALKAIATVPSTKMAMKKTALSRRISSRLRRREAARRLDAALDVGLGGCVDIVEILPKRACGRKLGCSSQIPPEAVFEKNGGYL